MKNLVAVVLVVCLINVVRGQSPTYYLNPDKKLTQYNVQRWTTDNGLPTNSLLSACQTTDGYLWIASYDGLIRFDGNEFKVFNKSNTKAFESNTIRKLSEDKDGTLWMTSQGNGLVSYKDGKFERYGEEQGINHLYRAIYIDQDGKIWSASPDKGWFYFANSEFIFLKHTEPLNNIEVRAIEQNKNKDMWFGTFGEGLYKYSEGKFTQYTDKDGLVNNWVYSLFYDSKGILWIGTSSGLCYFDGESFRDYNKVGAVTVNDIIEDKYSNIWFATNQGLFRQNINGSIEHLSSENGLSHNFINDFLIDLEGNIWMAFYKGGLAQLKDGKFTNYTMSGGLHGKVVNAICELEPDKYLTAFDNGKLSIIEPESIKQYRPKNNLTGERIRHLLKDSRENLWISTYSGLLKIAPDGREIWFRESTGFPETKIRLTFEDSKGRIWVGTRNSGVVRINSNNTYDIFNAANGLTANLIMSIDEDIHGNILIGTSEGESGLNIISDDKVILQYSKSEGFVSNVVFNTYCDKDGNVWVAALGGLVCIRNGIITNFTEKHGLVCDSPFDVVEDDLGYIWLPCSKGIMKIQKEALINVADGNAGQVNCRLFTQHDGMVVAECNPTTKSLKASNGMLLFPTINGIAQIDPSNILYNNYKPPVLIKQLKVDNNIIDLNKEISFKPGYKRFTLDYTAISLYEPDKVSFKYKLEGFDEDWVDAGNNRSISYTNLTHGKYTFKVIASNNDGAWNTMGASLSFGIKPRFINTLWFYFLVILLFIFISYSIYRLRIKQLERKQEDLERLIDIRTKEVREKNETLSKQKTEIETQAQSLVDQKRELNLLNASKDKMFSILAHDLRGPLGNFRTILDMVINAPEDFERTERNEMLELLSSNAQSTYELLENLLNWSSSQRGVITYEPEIISVSDVLVDILSFVSPMAMKKNINVHSTVDESIKVYADENMLRAIFRNLIGNAIKFTKVDGEISVSAKRKSDKIEFGVKDNGIGIQPKVKEKLFSQVEHTIRLGTNEEKGSGLGLLLCKEFIEKQGGNIWVESEIGKGSTFHFTLKITDR